MSERVWSHYHTMQTQDSFVGVVSSIAWSITSWLYIKIKFLLLASVIIAFTGCVIKENNPFLHEGYIRVDLGSLEAIKNEIIVYSTLSRKDNPRTIEVNLWKIKDVVYVGFAQGSSIYNFINLLNWLDNPPDNDKVGYTVGWAKSSTTGEEYYLYPEIENNRGDTLVGSSKKNISIRVYLPEAAISPVSISVVYQHRPNLLSTLGNPDLSFKIVIDYNSTFGNNEFVLTHEMDSTWGY